MKVDDVKLGMEVLVTDSFPTIERFIPVGFVGNIRGIKYSNSFDHIVVIIRNEGGLLFDIPIEGVQPIIKYIPCINDTIKFCNNKDTLSGVVRGIGAREKDYALFVKTDGEHSDFIMISSNQVLEHHIASYYHVSGEKVYD
jgi:hypothetical protein